MADLISITNRTRNEYGPGLHTSLVFRGGIEITKGKKIVCMEIDTCIVPGNEESPYESIVLDDEASNLNSFNLRCSNSEYIGQHFNIVNNLKRTYLEEKVLEETVKK